MEEDKKDTVEETTQESQQEKAPETLAEELVETLNELDVIKRQYRLLKPFRAYPPVVSLRKDGSERKRGIGITRKDKEESKSAKKSAKRQRLVNRKISSRKSRPTGSKQRK